jgi:glyoxylate reductase
LKYITHNGAGYDNIDIPACSDRGIEVSSTPVAVNDATADTALFLMLGALRQVTVPFLAVRKGEWRGKGFQLGHDPKKKVLGILGMGGIGKAVASRAGAFGMEIQYHNRRRLPEGEEKGAKYVSFDELLQTSDVISLNLALNASTRHIISKPEFDLMKTGVVIVNTARGPIIDEAALVDALNEGKVFSAGLDVFEEEPKIHPGLLENERVVLLPHIGTATWETQRDMELLVLENLRSAVEGKGLLTQLPEQKQK